VLLVDMLDSFKQNCSSAGKQKKQSSGEVQLEQLLDGSERKSIWANARQVTPPGIPCVTGRV
jgi:hypothetical protein